MFVKGQFSCSFLYIPWWPRSHWRHSALHFPKVSEATKLESQHRKNHHRPPKGLPWYFWDKTWEGQIPGSNFFLVRKLGAQLEESEGGSIERNSKATGRCWLLKKKKKTWLPLKWKLKAICSLVILLLFCFHSIILIHFVWSSYRRQVVATLNEAEWSIKTEQFWQWQQNSLTFFNGKSVNEIPCISLKKCLVAKFSTHCSFE